MSDQSPYQGRNGRQCFHPFLCCALDPILAYQALRALEGLLAFYASYHVPQMAEVPSAKPQGTSVLPLERLAIDHCYTLLVQIRKYVSGVRQILQPCPCLQLAASFDVLVPDREKSRLRPFEVSSRLLSRKTLGWFHKLYSALLLKLAPADALQPPNINVMGRSQNGQSVSIAPGNV